MTSLYQDIANLLRNAGYTGWIDLDKGQIENPEMFETITPALYVSIPDTQWDDLTKGNQLGYGILIVKWVFQLPSRTHAHDPLLSDSVRALEYGDIIHEAIKQHPNIQRRLRSRRYAVPRLSPYSYVVEQHYVVEEVYQRPIKSTPKPPPQISTVLTFPSNANHLNQ